MRIYGNLLALMATVTATAAPSMSLTDVAVGGHGGYFAYRIPSVVTAAKGTVVALFEGRKNDVNDSGDIDTLVMRSFDNGKSWTKFQVMADHGAETIGNPNMLIDRRTGTIWAFLSAHLARFPQRLIIAGQDSIHIFATKSSDCGAHWTSRPISREKSKARTSDRLSSPADLVRGFSFTAGAWWYRCTIAGRETIHHMQRQCIATITARAGSLESPPASLPTKDR